MTKGPYFPEDGLASGLRSLAAEKTADHPLPDPHLLWIKAQLEEQAALRERAMRPITIAEQIALLVLALLGGPGLVALSDWFDAWSGRLAEPDVVAWTVAGVSLLAVGFQFVVKPLMIREGR